MESSDAWACSDDIGARNLHRPAVLRVYATGIVPENLVFVRITGIFRADYLAFNSPAEVMTFRTAPSSPP